MYEKFTYIYHEHQPNEGRYTDIPYMDAKGNWSIHFYEGKPVGTFTIHREPNV